MKNLRFWAFTLLLLSPLFLPMRVTTAQLKATLEGHTDSVWSVAFSPDGKTLASASWDQTVRLWDVETEQLLHIFTGHTRAVVSVAFSPDGQTLASGSWDGTIQLWNPHTGGHKKTLAGYYSDGVESITFSPDGKMLASGSADQTVLLWNTTTWQVERTLMGHTDVIDAVAFSPAGGTLASGSRDETIRLWNPHTGKLNRTLPNAGEVYRLAFSPAGGTLASGSLDNTIRLWNPNTGELKRTLPNQGGWINPVAFSLDGGALAIGNRGISLWDTNTEQYKVPLIEDIGNALSVVFSPDGKMVATGSTDNLVRLLESTPPEVPFVSIPFDVTNIPEPVPPPKEVRDFFDLDSFYQQWINIEGFPVLASTNVSPYAVKEAAWKIRQMIGHRTDILKALAQNRIRFSIIAHNEVTTDIPELRDLPLPFYVNVRLRGGAGGNGHGTAWTSEEYVLGRWGYVTIHEMAHEIHGILHRQMDPMFDNRVETAYNAAMDKGLWQGRDNAVNKDEYWAEGVNIWFHTHHSSPVKTRDALKAYDSSLALLITEVLGNHDWRHTPLQMRTHLPHLQGFDPQSAPREVEWLPGVAEAYEELRDPAINERNEWVNLQPYNPSLIPKLNESRTTGDHTDIFSVNTDLIDADGVNETGNYTEILFVNTIDTEILLYWVNPDGTETLIFRVPPHSLSIDRFPCRAGDLLLAKDSTGKNLAVFQAVEKTGRALVAPVLNLITLGLSKVSGDNQAGVSSAVLAKPFVVELRDENLSPLEGISITFAVTAGDGTLSVTHTTTDENGQAESRFTLGTRLGTNTVSVSAAGIEQPVTFSAVAEAAVAIPDANLRAAIETALSKAEGDSITPSEMTTLTRLEAQNADISDLTGLEGATDLTNLNLGIEYVEAEDRWINSNSISDISLLAGLANLTQLWLEDNSISDISPLAGLTNLTWLELDNNSISDISPLKGLTNLTWLSLGGNSISDISPLKGLANLTQLWLGANSISDLSPLIANTGLGDGDEVYVQGTPLSYLSIHTHIPTLRSRGVTVEFDNQAHPAILKISGDNQKEAALAALPQPFVIEVQDESGSTVAGVSVVFAVTAGGGTLNFTRTTTDENGRAESTLTLGPNLGTNTVEVSANGIQGTVIFNAVSDTESPPITADVNGDGSVNVLDLVVIASELGKAGANLATDVNGDGVVNILDLILVAGTFDGAAAAPAAQPQVPETLTAVEVQGWLTDARALEVRNSIVKRGFLVLEQLLASLTPKQTELLANYPNPFNPETWIPYRLAEDASVTLTIYDLSGHLVRTLDVGHRIAAVYESESKAIYWNGRNDLGEQVTSGVYFYTLTAGNFSATRKMLILK